MRRVDHHPDPVDGRVGQEGFHRMAQHRFPGQQAVLLRHVTAEPLAAAGSHDQGGAIGLVHTDSGRWKQTREPTESAIFRQVQ